MPGLPLPGFSPRIFTTWVFSARILAAWILSPGFPRPDSRPWILTAWVFPTRVLAARVFTARVFLRDGQIHGVGAVVQRHIEEGGLGNRRRELAVNAAVRGQNAVALAGFIAGLRIQRRNLHLGLIADGGFARHQQLIAAAVADDIDVIEGFADKVQVAFQRQRADIAVAGRDMAAGQDLGLAQRAVAAQRAAGLDRRGAAVALPVIDVGTRRRIEDQRAAVFGAEGLISKMSSSFWVLMSLAMMSLPPRAVTFACRPVRSPFSVVCPAVLITSPSPLILLLKT